MASTSVKMAWHITKHMTKPGIHGWHLNLRSWGVTATLLRQRKRHQDCQQPNSALKTKHIEIRHHFLRDHVVKEDIDIIHVNIEQLADIFTKPLDEKRFCKLRCDLNILESSNVL